ncbi:MAG: hypothetical protein RML12_10120 [Xanthomonadales bacterium]|nr:hypothetical protein [Xanthomonadales bacterium]
MDRLAWLLRHRLVEIGFVPPIPDHAWPEEASRLPDLRLALAAPGGGGEEEVFEAFFRLRRHAGCLWLTD